MSFLDSLAPASGVAVPQPYQLADNAGADRGAYGGTQSLGQYNLGGQNLGQFSGLTQAGVNNPYATMGQTGAAAAGDMGTAAGQGAYGAGGSVMNSALGMIPDVTALTAMGFDPQGAYYARAQQQNADQAAALAARSGVAGTPYGQGVQNQSNNNFNIDWQNTALQRAATGAGTAGSLLGNIGQGVQQGAGIQAGGISEYLQGAMQPYNTFQGMNANQLALLNQAMQYGQGASSIPQQQIQDYLSYLNQSNQNANTGIAAQNLALNKAKAQFDEYNAIGQDAGKAVGMAMGNPFAFSGGFPGGGGGQANPYQTAQNTGYGQNG